MPCGGAATNLAVVGGLECRRGPIENLVFVATSGYDFDTLVVDPDGGILARAADDGGSLALSTVDLNRRYLDPWLGDMRGRFPKELRTDVR